MDIVQYLFILIVSFVDFNNGNVTCGTTEYPMDNLLNGVNYSVPWTAYLTEDSKNSSDSVPIPGIIISPSLIYLSANYIGGKHKPNTKYSATVGTTELNKRTANSQAIPVSFFSVHPNYTRIHDWRTTKNDFALAHLTEPIKLSPSLRPICIPSFRDKDTVLNTTGFDSLYLAGWNKKNSKFYGLGLQISSPSESKIQYRIKVGRDETLGNRYSANVSRQNKDAACVNRDIGSFYLHNGSFYFLGQVSNFVSNSKKCTKQAVHFIWSHTNDTLQWITNSINCGSETFTCFKSGQCIPATKLCDGKVDCEDQSDEEMSSCRNSEMCKADEFQCKVHGSCIPTSNLNDGQPDCPDGEDEKDQTNTINYLTIGLISSAIAVGVTVATLVYLWSIIKTLKSKIRNLSDEEIRDFLNGEHPPVLHNTLNDNPTSQNIKRNSEKYYPMFINSSILTNPWNNEYEVPFKYLEIGAELGRGQYGIVFKGQLRSVIKSINSESSLDVAVKTQQVNVDVEDFKNLLREIKILAHVGAHPSIVSFVGACTQHIKQRKVYLVVEFCSVGSLLSFLHTQDKEALQEICSSRNSLSFLSHDQPPGVKPTLHLNDLIKWARQIASGMIYLGLKNIIHGDLAARNILLNEHFDAKISDFGLSREINDTNVYIKTTQQPIPWKWLALESFTTRTFSYKSDVWAYGVTLWEIFSLGETPYGDIPHNSEFVLSLQNGYRLPPPAFASKDIFTLISSTWNEDPANRPSFDLIEQEFISITRTNLQ